VKKLVEAVSQLEQRKFQMELYKTLGRYGAFHSQYMLVANVRVPNVDAPEADHKLTLSVCIYHVS